MKKTVIICFLNIFLFSSVLYGQQTIKNLQWLNVNKEITELSQDNGITLYAQTENIKDGEPVTITIWSKGEEEDDFVGEYLSRIDNDKIAFYWIVSFELKKMKNSMKEIETNGFAVPQYYFIIQYNTIKSESSNFLAVKDYIKRQIVYEGTKNPARNAGYTLILPDKEIINGKTDSNGYVYRDNLFIGKYYIYLRDNDEDTDEGDKPVLPYKEPDKLAYYKIKEKESLWKIASYDFIYGNPYLWKKLYDANKSNLIDDKNPNLIEPEQVLIIPPVGNEKREGTR